MSETATDAPTLADFMEARIEDDLVAAHLGRSCGEVHPEADTYHEGGHPDSRAVAEAKAKIQILANARMFREKATSESNPAMRLIGETMAETAEDALRVLSAVYADHADYRPEWRFGA